MLDGHLADGQSSVADRAEQREQLGWLLKDLADLPDRQRTVLVMRELNGLDFAEIGAALDTSAAVVRQSLYEARRNLEQMGHGRSLRCDAVARVLSDADGRITRRRDIRAHLRDCPDCRRFQDAIESRQGILAVIPPVPIVAAAGLVQAAVGSSSSGVGLALTDGVAKSIGAYGALKAVGTVAAVAVLGTSAIQHGLTGGISDPTPRRAHPRAHSDDLSSSPALRKEQAVRPPHPGGGRQATVIGTGGRAVVAADRQVADLRRGSPARGLAFAAGVSSRPVDAAPDSVPPEASAVAAPPASEGEEPEKQPGPPPKAEAKSKPEKAKPEPEAEPAPSLQAASPEQPPVAEDTGPNGKAKGHEKHRSSEPDPD